MHKETDHENKVEFFIGSWGLILKDKYRILYILNDLLIGMVFLTGSILFIQKELQHIGTYFFISGSVLMLMRSMIRILRLLHIKKE